MGNIQFGYNEKLKPNTTTKCDQYLWTIPTGHIWDKFNDILALAIEKFKLSFGKLKTPSK